MPNEIKTTYDNGREFSHEDQAREYLRASKEQIAYEMMSPNQFVSKEQLENMKERLAMIKQMETELNQPEEEKENEGPRMAA